MVQHRILHIVALAGLMLAAVGCSKSGSPTAPPMTTPQLTAVPSSAAVGAGTMAIVKVSGGTPPYSISTSPSAIATAALTDNNSAVATLTITGVTIASASTSVTVRDSAAAKTVTIPISVH
jgi:hypothetical protein